MATLARDSSDPSRPVARSAIPAPARRDDRPGSHRRLSVFWQPYRAFATDHAPGKSPRQSPWLDDEFVERSARWRKESAAVRSAYERWASAEPCGRAWAWSAYRDALDREEEAARAYQECAERIARPRR
jgi:hypothetical protein